MSFFVKYSPYILALDILLTVFFGYRTGVAIHAGSSSAAAVGSATTVIWAINIVLDIVLLKQRQNYA